MSNNIAADRHRTRLHVLRDRLQRALRDEKRQVLGATARVALHRAARDAYRVATGSVHKPAAPRANAHR